MNISALIRKLAIMMVVGGVLAFGSAQDVEKQAPSKHFVTVVDNEDERFSTVGERQGGEIRKR
jgi:hypothetical protein